MITGIFLLDKGEGVTSAKALNGLKRKLEIEKIGHAGTLDPMATGLLVCLAGRATRLASFAESGEKRYSGSILLGRVTDTDDVTGTTIEEKPCEVSFEQIKIASVQFTGNLAQVPPQYSALKVDGDRAYDLARRGEKVELAARDIVVHEFSLTPGEASNVVNFVIRCSPGTYIRSLARDLGAALGVGGCLKTLRREASFPFDVSQAKNIDSITAEDILPWEMLFPVKSRVELSPNVVSRLASGDPKCLKEIPPTSKEGDFVLYGVAGETPRGILVWKQAKWNFGVNLAE